MIHRMKVLQFVWVHPLQVSSVFNELKRRIVGKETHELVREDVV